MATSTFRIPRKSLPTTYDIELSQSHSPERRFLLSQHGSAKSLVSSAPVLPPAKYEKSNNCANAPRDSIFARTWAWFTNVAGLLFAAAILIAIVVILRNYDGKLQPNWDYSLNLNSLVAILTTVLRTSLMDTVSDGEFILFCSNEL